MALLEESHALGGGQVFGKVGTKKLAARAVGPRERLAYVAGINVGANPPIHAPTVGGEFDF